MKHIFGRHLLVDGYVEDASKLDPAELCRLFDQIVLTLNMEYLQPPTAFAVPIDKTKLETEEDEGGWSVFCQITTSHLAIHAWPLRKAFMMDVFSCRDFDTGLVKTLLQKHLGLAESCFRDIQRGDPRAYI